MFSLESLGGVIWVIGSLGSDYWVLWLLLGTGGWVLWCKNLDLGKQKKLLKRNTGWEVTLITMWKEERKGKKVFRLMEMSGCHASLSAPCPCRASYVHEYLFIERVHV